MSALEAHILESSSVTLARQDTLYNRKRTGEQLRASALVVTPCGAVVNQSAYNSRRNELWYSTYVLMPRKKFSLLSFQRELSETSLSALRLTTTLKDGTISCASPKCAFRHYDIMLC